MAKKMVLHPLGDRVVVMPAAKEGEKKLASGIIIPADAMDKEKPAQGTVVAVGPGRFEKGEIVPMQVKVGDTVLFSKYGYDEVKVEGEEFYLLSESSILATIGS